MNARNFWTIWSRKLLFGSNESLQSKDGSWPKKSGSTGPVCQKSSKIRPGFERPPPCTPSLVHMHTYTLSLFYELLHKASWKDRREHTYVIFEKPFKCTMCGKSFSESGYLKRNLKGTKLERKHLSATNVTGVFQRQSLKFTRGLTGERNDLGAPNVTRVSLSQNTERIIIGAL